MLITAECIVTGDDVLRPGWVEIADGRIAAVGEGMAPRPADVELGAATVVPGFVDIHVHGGGGAAFFTCRLCFFLLDLRRRSYLRPAESGAHICYRRCFYCRV